MFILVTENKLVEVSQVRKSHATNTLVFVSLPIIMSRNSIIQASNSEWLN